jgi:hypothetical protein
VAASTHFRFRMQRLPRERHRRGCFIAHAVAGAALLLLGPIEPERDPAPGASDDSR